MAEQSNYRVTLLSDLVPALVAESEAAAAALASGRSRGPVTQMRALDDALGGFLAPGVHILQSAPGGGKTAFALQTAATCSFPSLYVTAEMPTLELFRRLIARATNTFLGKLKSGELGSREITRLAQATIEKSPWLAILDATAGYVPPSAIRNAASALRERAGGGAVLTVLDSLQYWARGAGELTEYELVSSAMRALSEVAAQLASPVLAISHRNREGNKGNGGLHAGKGSGDLEYVAESVLELAPEAKDAKPDAAGKTAVALSIHKNRHGAAGRIIPLYFTGRTQLFTEREK
jgi:replicative DNA helicase